MYVCSALQCNAMLWATGRRSQEVAAEKIRSAIKEGGHVAMYQAVHCSVTIGDGQVNPITKGLNISNYEVQPSTWK